MAVSRVTEAFNEGSRRLKLNLVLQKKTAVTQAPVQFPAKSVQTLSKTWHTEDWTLQEAEPATRFCSPKSWFVARDEVKAQSERQTGVPGALYSPMCWPKPPLKGTRVDHLFQIAWIPCQKLGLPAHLLTKAPPVTQWGWRHTSTDSTTAVL